VGTHKPVSCALLARFVVCPFSWGVRGHGGRSYSVHNAKRRIIETLCQIIVSKRRDLLSWRFFSPLSLSLWTFWVFFLACP